MKLPNVILRVFLSIFVIFSCVAQAKKVVLVAGERAPYISQHQLDYGYVYQVVKEAFLRQGYNIEVRFFPWSRAMFMTEQGEVDGIMPVYEYEVDHHALMVSNGFPGGSIGLLKKKEVPYFYPASDLEAKLSSLFGKTVGQIRGSKLLPELDKYSDIKSVYLNQILQGLDMLNARRIDYLLTDKYTAAFEMVDLRPQYIGQLEFLKPPLAEKQFHIAFNTRSSKSEALIRAFDRGLASIVDDGTLRKIQGQYGLLPREDHDDGKTHLVVSTVNNSDMLVMKSHIDEFEQDHPDIKVDWRIMNETVLRRRLLSDLALSDGTVDVMTIGNYEVPIWAQRGWLNKLESLPDEYDVQDIFPALRSSLSYQDHLYALPFYAESTMTYYRKDLFAKAGIVMPEVPTFDEIKQFASKIHNPDKHIYGICLRGKPDWGENSSIITSFVNAYGGRWFDEDWHPTLNTTAWKQALQFYYDTLSQYGPPNPEKNGYNENLKLFADGHCGIWIDATVAAGYLYNVQYSGVADDVAFTSSPKQKRIASWLWSWNFAIPYMSKHKDAARKFILWATSKKYIQNIGEESRWISVPPGTRLSTYASTNYQKFAPFSKFVSDALERATPQNAIIPPVPYKSIQYVDIPEFVALGAQVGLYMSKMLEGTITLEEALKYSQNSVYRQMSVAGYIKD